MREMIFAVVAMIIISVGASYLLGDMGFSSQDQTSGNSVRLD